MSCPIPLVPDLCFSQTVENSQLFLAAKLKERFFNRVSLANILGHVGRIDTVFGAHKATVFIRYAHTSLNDSPLTVNNPSTYEKREPIRIVLVLWCEF
jgi:hypothetical protein